MARGLNAGLTPIEAAVMRLWDEGHGSRAIARRTGLAEARIGKILTAYHGNEQRGHDAAIAAGSASLLAALQAAA